MAAADCMTALSLIALAICAQCQVAAQTIENALDAPVAFQNWTRDPVPQPNDPAGWRGQTAESYDGVDAGRTTYLSAGHDAKLSATLQGRGDVYFFYWLKEQFWPAGTAPVFRLTIKMDGVSFFTRDLSPGTGNWAEVGIALREAATYNFEWSLTGSPPAGTTGLSEAYLDQLSFLPYQEPPLPEALDAPASFTNWQRSPLPGQNFPAGWQGERSESHDGIDSVKATFRAAGHDAMVSTTVIGRGEVAFWYRVNEQSWPVGMAPILRLTVTKNGSAFLVRDLPAGTGAWSEVRVQLSDAASYDFV
jgi:hypothetical protein